MKSISWINVAELGKHRKILISTGLIVGSLALGGLGYSLTHPPKPWLVRWRVTRYLKKHGFSSDFKVDFPFPSKAEMARAPADPKEKPSPPALGTRTGKDFDALAADYLKLKTEAVILDREISDSIGELEVEKPRLEALTRQLSEARTNGSSTNLARLRSEVKTLQKRLEILERKTAARSDLQAKEVALLPITSDLWEFQRNWAAERQARGSLGNSDLTAASRQLVSKTSQKIGEATTYGQIYTLIGQELWVAGRLLKSANPDHRRVGLSIAQQACRHALGEAFNNWVATRICEGYIWPNLDLADTANRRSPFFLENILNECARAFRENDDFENLARNYELLIAHTPSAQRADWARTQIASAQQQAGNFKAALQALQEITLTNDFRWAIRQIPQLERRLGLKPRP